MNPCNALLPAALIALLAPATSVAAPTAQPAAPLTTGSVRLDIVSGRVEGEVCMSNLPAESRGAFVLNAGLNVARVTDGEGKPVGFDGWYDPGVDGEARVYTLAEPTTTLCVQYVGAFPLYPKYDALGDFKGMMAFNGDSARFTEQSAWLPQAFDPKARVRSSQSRYDLQVECAGCRFLYLNGSPAIEGARGRFRSDNARPILLFGGSGPITRTAQVTILNETLPTAKVDALSGTVQKVADVHSRYMGVPLADRPTFLRMVTLNQIERDREERVGLCHLAHHRHERQHRQRGRLTAGWWRKGRATRAVHRARNGPLLLRYAQPSAGTVLLGAAGIQRRVPVDQGAA